MALGVKQEEIVYLLQTTKNFLMVTLLGESLSPSTDMERKDMADKLEEMIKKLQMSINNMPRSNLQPIKSVAIDKEKPQEDEEYEVLDNVTKTPSINSPSQNSILSYEDLKQKVSEYQHYSISKLKEGSTASGYLLKHKNRRFTIAWHKRYCILKEYFIFYFKSETDFKELGVIILPGYTLTLSAKEKGHIFILEAKEKGRDSYTFQADSRDDFEKWRKSILAITNKEWSNEQLNAVEKVATDNVDKDDDNDSANCDGSFSNPSFSQQVQPEKGFSINNVWIGMFDCDGESSQDLSFKRGDIIYIYAEIDINWSMGYSNGKTGLVPNNYLTDAFQ
ncbi:src kinase-associated phosphoprotein 2-B isoform X4 [Hydra vulgaris]|uniref:src kinase-associated phosphoprotein 2-B isoform X4 n=1 Tax=Hydra vulgaris TaxID=6087 RepID=UPI001F5EAA9C|nr:src kinase-associated phosphoprotein 2-B-like isoform X3 [Hydra vulgaris]